MHFVQNRVMQKLKGLPGEQAIGKPRHIRAKVPAHPAKLLILVTPGRFELPTRSLGNCCSIHLSYGATCRQDLLVCSLQRQKGGGRFRLLPSCSHANLVMLSREGLPSACIR
jgi:hypothetical protein